MGIVFICKTSSGSQMEIFLRLTVSVECSWCKGLSDQSFMVDPFSYFLFQPEIHKWYNKGHGMCYCVFGMVHIKDFLLLIIGGSWFSLSLSGHQPYIRHHITGNKICYVHCKMKHFIPCLYSMCVCTLLKAYYHRFT